MKAFYKNKPAFNAYALSNGDVAVCINWKEESIVTDGVTIKMYSCERVDVSEPTADLAIEKFVRSKYSASEEFALINAYNASVSGVEKDADKEAEYLSFLAWLKAMKEDVKTAIAAYNAANGSTTNEEEIIK